MDQWAGKVALVTGASSGIGAETAKELAKGGMKVIAVARRLENLKELAASIKREFNVQIYPIKCDVQQEEQILKVFKWAEEELGGVDVLVNNAGVISHKLIIEESTETFHRIIDVNVIAMAICSRELAQSIKKRKASGHIININSVAGHYADSITVPLSLYSASKYAVTGMSANLRNDIKRANLDIKITSISPGMVKTDMVTKRAIEIFGDLDKVKNCPPLLEDKDIADLVIHSLSTPRHVQICEVIVMPYEATKDVKPKL